jgi:hypothetical protein
MPTPPRNRAYGQRLDSNSAPTQISDPKPSDLGVVIPLIFETLTPGFAQFTDGEKRWQIPVGSRLFCYPDGYTILQSEVYRQSHKLYWDDEIETESRTGVRDSFLRSIWLRRLREKHISALPIPFD